MTNKKIAVRKPLHREVLPNIYVSDNTVKPIEGAECADKGEDKGFAWMAWSERRKRAQEDAPIARTVRLHCVERLEGRG